MLHQTLIGSLAAALLTTAPLLAAAEYPEKPVRIVIPYPAGGGPDGYARVLAEGMAKHLGASIVVEAKPGAGSIIGTDYVARADPDGYTLLLGTLSLATAPLLSVNANWNPHEDFDGVAEIVSAPVLAVVNADFAVESLDDLVAEARAKPGEINYLMPGRGTSMHLNSASLWMAADIDVMPVAYQGIPSGMPDLLTNRVSFSMSPLSLVAPHLESGKLRALAVAAPRRLESHPDLPTFAEAGYADAQVVSWYALVAPKGTPRDAIDKLNVAANAALQDPAIRAQMERMGGIVAEPNTPAELDAMLQSEFERWQEAFPKLGLERQ